MLLDITVVNKNEYTTNTGIPKSAIIIAVAIVLALILLIISIVSYIRAVHRTHKNVDNGNVGLTIQSIVSVILLLVNILLSYFMPNFFDTNWQVLDMATNTALNIAIIILAVQIFTFAIIILTLNLRTKKTRS